MQKYKQLEKQAVLLGRIRSEVWAKYGAISGLNISDRAIRDAWMKESRDFGVSANAWKETLYASFFEWFFLKKSIIYYE